jgi:uroporphyrinogen decarboxylase
MARTLAFGTPDEVVADTRGPLEALATGGGYLVASSHSITPAVPPENFLAMVEATVRYGSYGRAAVAPAVILMVEQY